MILAVSEVLKELGKRLKRQRKAAGLSQRELSELSGVAQPHISRIERGEVDLRASSLFEIARAMSSDFLLVPNQARDAAAATVRHIMQPPAPEEPELNWRLALERDEQNELDAL